MYYIGALAVLTAFRSRPARRGGSATYTPARWRHLYRVHRPVLVLPNAGENTGSTGAPRADSERARRVTAGRYGGAVREHDDGNDDGCRRVAHGVERDKILK